MLIRHSDREGVLDVLTLGVEPLYGRVGIVQGVDVLSGGRIDVQRAVLSLDDRSLAVDGEVQVADPFVVLDELAQASFLRDGHVFRDVQDVFAGNHFGAVVGAVDGDGNFLLDLLAVFITHVDDERVGQRLALSEMVGQLCPVGRVGVGAVAVLIEGQRDSAVLGRQRVGSALEVVLERRGFGSLREGLPVSSQKLVDVMRLQGS